MNVLKPALNFGLVDRQAATAMPGMEFIEGLRDGRFPAPPVCETADFWITEVEPGRVVFEALPSRRFYNPLGTIHGGWLSTVLDSAMGCAVHTTLRPGQAFTTIDMTVSFVRPVFDGTGRLTCEGKVVHGGRRIATAEGRISTAAGTLIAHGSETCMLLDVAGAGQ